MPLALEEIAKIVLLVIGILIALIFVGFVLLQHAAPLASKVGTQAIIK